MGLIDQLDPHYDNEELEWRVANPGMCCHTYPYMCVCVCGYVCAGLRACLVACLRACTCTLSQRSYEPSENV